MTSLSRALAVLDLFTADHMIWTAEEMIRELGYTRPTGYRYICELVDIGVLARFGDGSYSLGARIVELDFLIRQADPTLSVGLPTIRALAAETGFDINLVSLYGSRIVTTYQEPGTERLPMSFNRGRRLPELRGAGSKIIIAQLSNATLKRIYEQNKVDAADVGFGESWAEFIASCQKLRHAGYAVSRAELDEGMAAAAVPLFTNGAVSGALVATMTLQRLGLTRLDGLVELLKNSAATINGLIAELVSKNPVSRQPAQPKRA